MCTPLLLVALLLAPAPPRQDVAALARELLAGRDQSDPELVSRLAAAHTREAAEALVEAYGVMSSILMRREIVLCLAVFDDVPGAAALALQQLSDVATLESEPELNEAAVDALARCPLNGPDFLRRIVDSSAQDGVRLRAMQHLVEIVAADDLAWFRAQFERPRQEDDKEVRRALRSGEKVERVTALAELRELAFTRLAPGLDAAELAGHARAKERDPLDLRQDGVRRLALLELERRGDKRLAKLATEVFEDRTETDDNRALAARLMAAAGGAKLVPRLCEQGLEDPSVTSPELARALAELVASLRGPKDEKKLVKLLEQGRPHEQLFALRALRGAKDPELFELVDRLLAAGLERAAAQEALALLGESGAQAARAILERELASSADPSVAAAACEALSALRAGDPGWVEELERLARAGDRRLRNGALGELARLDARAHQELFVEALSSDDWTTRKVALEALEAARTREAVAAIVARIGAEEGRLLHLFADALFRLTGQPFHVRSEAWRAWWEKEGAAFEPIDPAELAALEREHERRRLAQTTRASSFFGLRVESRQVVFVLDVSGSMDEHLVTRWLGEEGATRIAEAKRELAAVIDSLEPGTFFDLIVFAGEVERWADGGRSTSEPGAREEAQAFVERLRAGGGTNLYGALSEAFRGAQVDTIFVLSDGEPSQGSVVDPAGIRRAVSEWNRGRGIAIHTVSVGGGLPILEWLAQDSGGSFTRIR